MTKKVQKHPQQPTVALYCRVSTDEQAREGISLEEQQERLRAYCTAMGWPNVVRVYVDDGYSAKSLDRPELQKLIADVKSGQTIRVLVTKLDRMSRRLLDLLNLIDLFARHGVSFVSISESFDTNTPSGRLTLQVLGAVAEFERERIRERVFENMLHAASKGKWLTQSPYGYGLVDKELEIIEQEAVIVRNVYEWYVHDGQGFYAIARRLNLNGIPTKYDKQWSIRTVKLMLSNPVYKGTLVWNRPKGDGTDSQTSATDQVVVDDCLPAIIDKSLWEQAQQRMSQSTIAPRAKTSPHLLGGLLKCGRCGSGMSIGYSGSPQRRYRVYRCSANKNKGTCVSKQYRADEVEAWFKQGLAKFIPNLDASEIQIDVSHTKDKRRELEQKVRAAKARYSRKVEAFTSELIGLNELQAEKARLDQALEDLKHYENEQDFLDHDSLQQHVNSNFRKIAQVLEYLPPAEAKALLQTEISEIVIHGEANIEVVLHPFHPIT